MRIGFARASVAAGIRVPGFVSINTVLSVDMAAGADRSPWPTLPMRDREGVAGPGALTRSSNRHARIRQAGERKFVPGSAASGQAVRQPAGLCCTLNAPARREADE